MRPLDGITVVALEHVIAAPFATRQLADLGARVIKIERPGSGDFARNYDQRAKGMSSHFTWVNRSKESLTLDLKHKSALEILRKLLETADVFVQNLAPGAAARMGLTPQTLQASNPQLIYCNLSGYGENGPYRDKKAYDLLIQSEAGLLSITGTPETPSKVGISIADIAAGMYTYTNILAALLQRQKTGKGSVIDISMLEALGEWMGYPMYYSMDGAAPPPRTGASHATIFPYGPYLAGDGKTIMLGLQNEREWALFCEKVLLQPELATDRMPISVGQVILGLLGQPGQVCSVANIDSDVLVLRANEPDVPGSDSVSRFAVESSRIDPPTLRQFFRSRNVKPSRLIYVGNDRLVVNLLQQRLVISWHGRDYNQHNAESCR
ncbi:MAG: hypothetical protein RLZZ539_1149 [Pseudomonadota bacterium]